MRIGLHVHVRADTRKRSSTQRRPARPRCKSSRRIRAAIARRAIDVPALEAFAEHAPRGGHRIRASIHTPYLINLASADPKISQGSLRLLRARSRRRARAAACVSSTRISGSYGTRDRSEGFAAICRALEAALADIEPGVFLVLENSAGAGKFSRRDVGGAWRASYARWRIRSSAFVSIRRTRGRRATRSTRRTASTASSMRRERKSASIAC